MSLLIAALAGAGGGYFAWRLWLYEAPPPSKFVQLIPDKAPEPPPSLLGQARPDFALLDVDGNVRRADEWQGRVLLINFWATWCAPCRKEMPLLVALQSEFGSDGLQVIGLAMDKPEPVRDFGVEFAISFPLLVGESEVMRLTRAYGNRLGALPYTAIVDRAGKLVYLKAGLVKRAQVEPVLRRLL